MHDAYSYLVAYLEAFIANHCTNWIVVLIKIDTIFQLTPAGTTREK